MVGRMFLMALVVIWFGLISPDRSFALNSPAQSDDSDCMEESIDRGESRQSLDLPSNIFAPDCLRPMLRELLRRSATFRRQCRKIGDARNLIITIKTLP